MVWERVVLGRETRRQPRGTVSATGMSETEEVTQECKEKGDAAARISAASPPLASNGNAAATL